MMKGPGFQPVKQGRKPAVRQVFHMPFFRIGQITERRRNQDDGNNKEQHDIDSGHYTKFFQDGTFGKCKYTKSDGSRDIAKKGHDAHFADHLI